MPVLSQNQGLLFRNTVSWQPMLFVDEGLSFCHLALSRGEKLNWPSLFAPVQDEDQRWDGPEEADPVSGRVHGAPREDEASSTGWVWELSSEDGGHAAVHGGSGVCACECVCARIADDSSSASPSLLIVCVLHFCPLFWDSGAFPVSHHQAGFCLHHWHKDGCRLHPSVLQLCSNEAKIWGVWTLSFCGADDIYNQSQCSQGGGWKWAAVLCSQSHGRTPNSHRSSAVNHDASLHFDGRNHEKQNWSDNGRVKEQKPFSGKVDTKGILKKQQKKQIMCKLPTVLVVYFTSIIYAHVLCKSMNISMQHVLDVSGTGA